MSGLAVATLHVIAITETRTWVAHLVTDEAAAAGRRVGRYLGVRGAVVLPGNLTEDTNRYCRSCQCRAVAR